MLRFLYLLFGTPLCRLFGPAKFTIMASCSCSCSCCSFSRCFLHGLDCQALTGQSQGAHQDCGLHFRLTARLHQRARLVSVRDRHSRRLFRSVFASSSLLLEASSFLILFCKNGEMHTGLKNTRGWLRAVCTPMGCVRATLARNPVPRLSSVRACEKICATMPSTAPDAAASSARGARFSVPIPRRCPSASPRHRTRADMFQACWPAQAQRCHWGACTTYPE